MMAGATLRLAHPRCPRDVMTPIQDDQETRGGRGDDPRMAHPSAELRNRLTSDMVITREYQNAIKDSRTICSQYGSQGPKSGQSQH